MATPSPFGRRLRQWRRSRSLSQLDLAGLAQSTTRYISFMENGRSRPSEQMVHRIADALGVSVRERDELLEAAGFAAASAVVAVPESGPPSRPYQGIVRRIITTHEPYPAVVLNRWWDLVDANQAAGRFFGLIDPSASVSNMIEWMFGAGPEMRARFESWPDSAFNMLRRLRREMVDMRRDERLEELVAFAERQLAGIEQPPYDSDEAVKCATVTIDGQLLRLMGMVARFGSAREVLLDELRVELLYPRDDVTEAFLRNLADAPPLRLAR
jgi:transcriptional regulator with XRE-family HTH domain